MGQASQDLEAKFEAFFRHLEKERRLSSHTVSAYRSDLSALVDFSEDSQVSISSLDTYFIRRFAAHSHRKGYSPRSIARRLSAIRRFFQF